MIYINNRHIYAFPQDSVESFIKFPVLIGRLENHGFCFVKLANDINKEQERALWSPLT